MWPHETNDEKHLQNGKKGLMRVGANGLLSRLFVLCFSTIGAIGLNKVPKPAAAAFIRALTADSL